MIIFIIYNKDKILYFRYRIQILYNNTKNIVQFFLYKKLHDCFFFFALLKNSNDNKKN